jgi:hypothetical protein
LPSVIVPQEGIYNGPSEFSESVSRYFIPTQMDLLHSEIIKQGNYLREDRFCVGIIENHKHYSSCLNVIIPSRNGSQLPEIGPSPNADPTRGNLKAYAASRPTPKSTDLGIGIHFLIHPAYIHCPQSSVVPALISHFASGLATPTMIMKLKV